MTKIKLYDLDAKALSDIEIKKDFVLPNPHKQAMFDQVLAENAGQRQGTHSTLTKAEVRGGGRKPRPQKHSGNARQGSIRNPQWVGGGVAFGPKPNRNYKLKINSKISKLALLSIFSQRLNENKIFALTDKILIDKPSTKKILTFANQLNIINNKVLFICNDDQKILIDSINNITNMIGKKWNQVSVRDFMNANTIIIQDKALKNLMEVMQ